MTETGKLLAEYVKNGSEMAFQDLVERYINLVYSTARRLVGGDSHLAEDVTQTVFVHLARKAQTLSGKGTLGGWLHRDTCYSAATLLRSERRRRQREKQAVEMNALENDSEFNGPRVEPILDEVINLLGVDDRAAIVLRFFEQQDFSAVGAALGSSEDAARMRVNRALTKLNVMLKRRGVTFSAAALGAVLTSQASSAAPSGLSATVVGTALANSSAYGTTFSFLKLAALAKVQSGLIGAIVLASLAMPILVQHRAQAGLRQLDGLVKATADRVANLQVENAALSNSLVQATGARAISNRQLNDVLRLRGEVGRFRKEAEELARLTGKTGMPRADRLTAMAQRYSARISQLKQFLETNPAEKIPEMQYLEDEDWLWLAGEETPDSLEGNQRAMSMARLTAEEHIAHNVLRPALLRYAQDNNGKSPADLAELKPYFQSPIDDALLQRWQIIPASSLINLQGNLQGEDSVITQRNPVNVEMDQRVVFSTKDFHLFADAPPEQWQVAHQP